MVLKSLDFTLDTYQELCRVLGENYTVYTVSGYLSEKPEGNIAVMRHDVDRKITNSLNMAKREHEMGIRSSYYFRYPHSNLISYEKSGIWAMKSAITMKS
jgi:hypothetical protein